MTSQHCLHIVAQRSDADCSVACVAMLCGVAYEQALLSFDHDVFDVGATRHQIKKAIGRLGHTVHWSKNITDLENDFGILWVSPRKGKLQHVVILWEGHIVATDETIYDYDAYMAHHEFKPRGIFTIKEG